ncbi:MAG TPA: hypothetical protein VFB00_01485 [Terriglobales bacterium]|nr:hypothetical protein [Terriglobales bacterium]
MDGVSAAGAKRCAICGRKKREDETWFLIDENCWEDRLNIWKWSCRLADSAAAQALCSPAHVRQLVAHWMTTACLRYPFASSTSRLPVAGPSTRWRGASETNPRAQLLGEIAVDRQSMVRILRERPFSLNTILEELMLVLENELLDEAMAEPEDEAGVWMRST